MDDHFFVRDGDHNRLPDEEIVHNPSEGVRYLRAQDLKEGAITADDPVYVTRRYYESVARSHIRPGQLLFSIMGSVGNQAIVPDGFVDATANRAVGILEPKRADPVLTKFLFLLFLTDLGAQLYERVKKGGLQMRTNLADVEKLQFPLVPEPHRSRLVAALDAARATRRRKLEEAESLLGGLDAFVLDALGLTLPPPDGRTVYAVRLRDVDRGRFDPHFFRPEYRELSRRIAKVPHRPLGKLVRLSREIWSPSESAAATFRYIEISGVNTTTGEANAVETHVAEAPSRARMQVRRGDVIVSLTRPHYGAIAAIDDSLDRCIASTGFAVLRDLLVDDLDRSYLWTVLRCQMSLMQMQQRSSGGNYPAITEDELQRVLVPVPDDATQKKIAAEVSRRRDAARRLRDDAARLWADAKRRFEEEVLGVPVHSQKGGR
jgi:hypothetical protein